MRIKSDFKDYYDVGMAQGQDETLVYLRYAKVIEPEHYPFSAWWSHDHYRPLYGEPALWTDQSMIGFCGKLIPVIELNEPNKNVEKGVPGVKEERILIWVRGHKWFQSL